MQAGPGLVAFSAALMAHFRQSKRGTASFLCGVFHIPASPGWVIKLQGVAADAVALPSQPVPGLDESPTKQAKAKAWLWTFVATAFTVFAYRLSRAAEVPRGLLGTDYAGVVMCDRAKMYWSVGGRLQWCWAHLRRDFQALIDHPDTVVNLSDVDGTPGIDGQHVRHQELTRAAPLLAEAAPCLAGHIKHLDPVGAAVGDNSAPDATPQPRGCDVRHQSPGALQPPGPGRDGREDGGREDGQQLPVLLPLAKRADSRGFARHDSVRPDRVYLEAAAAADLPARPPARRLACNFTAGRLESSPDGSCRAHGKHP